MSQIQYSLIVTVKNDAPALIALLADIESQTLLPDEVILSIAPSGDDSLKIAQQWKPKKIQKKVLELEAGATRSRGRNAGVQASTGKIVCFTDAGCHLSPSWFEKIIHAFSLPETKLASGFTTYTKDSPQEEVQGAFTLVPLSKIEKYPLPATRNMAVRKEVFKFIGPFRDELNYAEDYEWSRRARKKGVHATFVPDAKVWWKPRHTWPAFWQMIFQLTRGDMLAATWRWGHLSMWMRYFMLLFISWLVYQNGAGVFLAFLVFVALWTAYIGLKIFRLSFDTKNAILYLPLAQFLTDTAVLAGTVVGLLQKWQHLKQQRKARYV